MFFSNTHWTQLTAPLFETSIYQNSIGVFSYKCLMRLENTWRDQRPFLHPESLQILQIHSSMTVLLLFSSHHSFSTGFRSEDWNGHSRSLVLCPVTHFCVVLRFVFGLLYGWKIQTWPIIRFLTVSVTFKFFICWYLMESVMPCI